MRLSYVALANLRRRKGRTAFLVVGLAVGIGTVVALYTLSAAIKDEIGQQMDQYGANIVVVPKTNMLALNYGGISVSGVSFDMQSLTVSDLARIHEIPYRNRLSTVAPKLLAAASVDGHEFLLAGVRFDAELRMKQWWRVIGEKPSRSDDLLLGMEVARELEVIEPGAPATPASGGHHTGHGKPDRPEVIVAKSHLVILGRSFRVAGVLRETGARDDQMIFADLEQVQRITSKTGQLSLIEISALCKDCPIDAIVSQIQGALPAAKVSAVQQAVRARTETVARLNRFSAVIAAIVLLIGGLMIAGTVTGSVVERTQEIGVLRAVGYRKRHVTQMLLIEVSILSLLGGLIGWSAGAGGSVLAVRYFTDSGDGVVWRPELGLAAMLLALALGLFSSALPARRAAKLDPTEALRHL
ncbi:MAG: ABC transporter permease [Acidobacteriota bacterium]